MHRDGPAIPGPSAFVAILEAMSSSHGHPLPFYDFIENLIHNAHEAGGYTLPGRPLMLAFPLAMFAFFMVAPQQMITNLEFILFFAPLWIPIVLARFALARFIQMRRVAYLAAPPQKSLLLEIRMPRDTRKTPQAMETFFSSLSMASGEATWYKRYVLGQSRPSWSFEIVSLGGRVHFYVWTRDRFRRPLESFLYAQYPGIEVVEATDYSRLVDPTHPPYVMSAFEYVKTNPIDAYPIKTYIDFGLDKTPVAKPEEQTDPISQIIEALGSVGPHEQVWLQFVIRVTKYEKYNGRKNEKGKTYTWKDEGRDEVERIRKEVAIQTEYRDPATGEWKHAQGFPNPTEGQKDRIKAIERNIGKLAFDVGIRSIYFATEDSFHKGMGSVITNIFKPFSSEQFNGLKPNTRWSEHFNDYPWEDPGGPP